MPRSVTPNVSCNTSSEASLSGSRSPSFCRALWGFVNAVEPISWQLKGAMSAHLSHPAAKSLSQQARSPGLLPPGHVGGVKRRAQSSKQRVTSVPRLSVTIFAMYAITSGSLMFFSSSCSSCDAIPSHTSLIPALVASYVHLEQRYIYIYEVVCNMVHA